MEKIIEAKIYKIDAVTPIWIGVGAACDEMPPQEGFAHLERDGS